MSGGGRTELERIEREIDVTEAQLEGMREVRASVVGKALPAILLVGVLAYGAMGWGITEPLGGVFAAILLGATGLLGAGAHLGVRQGERRLALLEEDLAMEIGRGRVGRGHGERGLGDGRVAGDGSP